ncbi:bifunctional 2-polyprenyl-6-hydroxyphenol methylase/3-demethylubiquinol 3-O-methyltransferase UbiG [Mycobacterium sp.]|uniref:class I SAM-dependent methyltransferase n=1 Tax=Mycobacterium sp. TaxID=1785 RepID=UPI00127AE123|nr:class I SAM-dependent methyltransferase [Mycobacterium sp.]KAA8966032.1 MAG: class I SAM-dependent methyltransferase [Mycobacterium sp.]
MWRTDRAVTADLRRRFLPLEPVDLDRFRRHLLDNWSTRDYWQTESGSHQLEQHTVGRLIYDRHEYMPWLNALRPLPGARVFEIGCGTGSSTFALAEQGAQVTAVDVMADSVAVSQERLRLFGLGDQSLHHMNATDIGSNFDQKSFDFVLFFASLEHMTTDERLTSLRAAWNLLVDDGILGIIEAPNRLWLYDDHTADLPFFHWLPDEIALQYIQETPRYRAAPFDIESEEAEIELIRRGRGVSYHEIELALGPVGTLEFLVDRHSFQIKQNMLRWLRYRFSTNRRYANLLRRQRPDLPLGLFLPYLDIAIRKNPACCGRR